MRKSTYYLPVTPDHIREHLEKTGYRHQYMNYAQGAHYYELPYWSFVNLAKEAGATVVLHKTAIADIPLVDKYLDEYCLVPAAKTNKKKENCSGCSGEDCFHTP